MNYLTPIVPAKCLICEAPLSAGHQPLSGNRMRLGLRMFYKCGASISVTSANDGCFQLLIKNCHCEHNAKLERDQTSQFFKEHHE